MNEGARYKGLVRALVDAARAMFPAERWKITVERDADRIFIRKTRLEDGKLYRSCYPRRHLTPGWVALVAARTRHAAVFGYDDPIDRRRWHPDRGYV